MDPRGDGPFQVLERIRNNTYKIGLPGEYLVSATFNVDVDSRTNLFEKGRIGASKEEELKLPMGPVTRPLAKKLKYAFQTFVSQFLEKRLGTLALDIKSGLNKKITEEEQPINLIQACGLDLVF